MRFKLLPKVNSFRLAGRRYFPGDQIELTQEQADRFNPDLFAKIEPTTVMEKPEPIVVTIPFLQVSESISPEKPKLAAKKSGYARKPKP